jgi:ribose transport system ATP-binding protein
MSGADTEHDRENILLDARGIVKNYPGVLALDNVDFSVRKGEVHCLAGENGAGKSTLIEIIGGSYSKDAGSIRIDGQEVEILNPKHAQDQGIAVLHQELPILSHLSVAENIFIGRQPTRGMGLVSYPEMHRQASRWLDLIQADIDPHTLMGNLPTSKQQLVSIAKALSLQARVIIFDEPSATLTTVELKRLFEIIRSLKTEGRGIVYISHRLEEIFEIGDRVTVLRNGKLVGTEPTGAISRGQLIRMLVGHEVTEAEGYRGSSAPVSSYETVLEVRRLTRKGVFENVSFSLGRGEVLGIYGLVGAGRTEVVRAILGADKIDAGEIYLVGRRLNLSSPKDVIRAGLCLAPEDRKRQGLLLGKSVQENIALPSLRKFLKGLLLSHSLIARYAGEYINRLRIVTPSYNQKVRFLSGGNQQKVVLAKWLGMDLKVYIFDEPTHGIDVGAKEEIRSHVLDLARQGKSIILISSELPEILSLSDRILVMHGGRVTADLPRTQVTKEKLIAYSMGASET